MNRFKGEKGTFFLKGSKKKEDRKKRTCIRFHTGPNRLERVMEGL